MFGASHSSVIVVRVTAGIVALANYFGTVQIVK